MTKYLSASQIKKFRTCPGSYKLKYIDRLPGTKYGMGYAERGSAVHSAIENALLKGVDRTDLPALEAVLKTEFRQQDPQVSDKMYRECFDFLEAAARYLHKRSDAEPRLYTDPETGTKKMGVEASHRFKITRPDINRDVVAIMDVCTGGPDSPNEIWDWKTGVIRDDTHEEEFIQGGLYMAAYTHLFGEEPDAIRFVYLKEQEVRTIEPSTEAWEQLLTYIRPLIRAEQTGEYPYQPSGFCYFCDHEAFCPAAKGGCAQAEYELY